MFLRTEDKPSYIMDKQIGHSLVINKQTIAWQDTVL